MSPETISHKAYQFLFNVRSAQLALSTGFNFISLTSFIMQGLFTTKPAPTMSVVTSLAMTLSSYTKLTTSCQLQHMRAKKSLLLVMGTDILLFASKFYLTRGAYYSLYAAQLFATLMLCKLNQPETAEQNLFSLRPPTQPTHAAAAA